MEPPNEIKFGTTGDEFKPLVEVALPDIRQQSWVRIQPDGTFLNVQLKELHERMSNLTLNPTVPKDVRTGFDTARNLYLYSWFVYRFRTVAELQAYASLEFALGVRLKDEQVTHIVNLSNRLASAVSRGWLRAEGVRRFQEAQARRKLFVEEQEQIFSEISDGKVIWQDLDARTESQRASAYLQHLKEGIPIKRNSIAHGEPLLGNGPALSIEICCDLINQLFPEGAAS